MKKYLIISVLFVSAVAIYAADLAAVEGNRSDRVRSELQTGWNALVAGTGSLPEVQVDSKYVVVGGDATTGLMVQAASVTALNQTVMTNTFAVAFGAAPVVTTTYTEDPGDVRSLFLGTITASNFICTITADKNFSYVAVGARP